MTFQDLKIIPSILKALTKEGYEAPTPIQEQAIPTVLEGRDLLGCAQTGTGKTAAFAVPILQRLCAEGPQNPRRIRTLVLTPTRELALQILESFDAYGRYLPLRACVVFGGVPQNPQVAKLRRGVDILVATPGRLNDLIGQGHIDLSHLEIFVLDEADRMLDMGFIQDVRRVLEKLPAQKQTLFFSATMPSEINELADSLLHNPEKVTVTPPATTVDSIVQSVYFVDKGSKKDLLALLLQNSEIESALVFTRTKHGADRVVRELTKEKINAAAIHGDKSQNARQLALGNFKKRITRVLVATDIAARGIDIDELSHVINYDIPEVPETYVHRIGRTGRAGLSGIAVSFCDINEKSDLKAIERLIGKAIPVVEDHPFPMRELVPTPKSQLRGNRGGQRPQRPQQEQSHTQGKPRRAQERPVSAQTPKQGQQLKQAQAPKQGQYGKTAQKGQRPSSAPKRDSSRQEAAKQPAALPMFEKPRDVKPMRYPKMESLTEKPERRGSRDGRFAASPRKTDAARKRPDDQPLGQTRFSHGGHKKQG